MGILDEAIREHLDLKRQHGADEIELKQLEDEAFGAAERPGDETASAVESEAPTQFMAQPDAAPEEGVRSSETLVEEPPHPEPSRRESAARIADLQEPPEAQEEEAEEAPHEEVRPGPSTEERNAIAEQPTEMYDVEGEGEGAATGDAEAVEEHELEDEEDEEFWSEQRLSDELDQALDAPLEDEGEFEEVEEAPDDEEAHVEPEAAHGEAVDEESSPTAERDEDVLEDTPDFLEESPEDDELWFEQKPPKDFDFDD
jgi:hypothetical protein